MPSLEHTDSLNPAVRAIERWKRGLAVLVVLGVAVIAAALPAALIGWAASYVGADEVIVGTIAFLVIAPWMLGGRDFLEIIGSLDKAPDS